jgi:GNAT superfamily N-acetyltransferase
MIGNGCGMKNVCRSLAATPMYRVREVDGQDDEIGDTLAGLHRLTFFNGARLPDFDWGHWWLACHEATPVAFAGLVPSTHAHNAGYICRVGVLKKHCGRRLQLRLMRAMESRARHNGWNCVVSDTTENPASANNFIRAGYRLYLPPYPWAYSNTLYWRKVIA